MIQPTRVGLLRLTAQLPDAVSIAIALVHDAVDDFVPGLSNLIEGSGFRLLALVWGRSRTTQQSLDLLPIRKSHHHFPLKIFYMSAVRRLVNSHISRLKPGGRGT